MATFVVALAASAMLVIMLVCQLYGFEDFSTDLSVVLPTTNPALIDVAAGLIVFAELFALPYLLGMYVSRLMRIMSALLAAGIGFFWLFTAFTNAHAANSALFSSTLIVPGGIWPALWSCVLVCAVAFTIAADSRFRHATS